MLSRALVSLALGLFAGGCVSSTTGVFVGRDGGVPDGGVAGGTITIQNYTFAPLELEVAPGETVTVLNLDGDDHTVTSQDAPGRLQLGSVNNVWFDSAPFVGTAGFAIPADAPVGTVVYYFCAVHGAEHGPARITVRPPATAPSAP